MRGWPPTGSHFHCLAQGMKQKGTAQVCHKPRLLRGGPHSSSIPTTGEPQRPLLARSWAGRVTGTVLSTQSFEEHHVPKRMRPWLYSRVRSKKSV